MECERLPFVPDTPNDDLVLLHQYHVSDTYALHRHEFYEVFYVIKGQAMHEINGSSQVVSEGSLVFIRPNDAHQYKYLNLFDFEFVNVNITWALTSQAFRWLRIPLEYFTSPALPPTLKLTGIQHQEMRRKFLELSQMPPGPGRRRCFCALFPEIILLLFNQENMEKTQVVPRWLSDVLKKLDDPACFTLGLPELLRMTPYTQEHLTRCFRKYVHLTPTAYINQKRLGYAASLLISEPLPPPAVAQRVGFNNISHFYHLFRQQYGCTPLQFSTRYRDTQKAQTHLLGGISHDAARLCDEHNATRIGMDNGIFAYYMQEGLAHIYLSFAVDATERNLTEISAYWDPRISPGATLHINCENPSLFTYICTKFSCIPVQQSRELTLTRERFMRSWPLSAPPGVELTGYDPTMHDQYLDLLHQVAPSCLTTVDWPARGAQGRFLALFCEDALAGIAGLSDQGVDVLAIQPAFRRRGLGSYLLHQAVAQFFDREEAPCLLCVDDRQVEYLAFLDNLPFVQTAHEAVFRLRSA